MPGRRGRLNTTTRRQRTARPLPGMLRPDRTPAKIGFGRIFGQLLIALLIVMVATLAIGAGAAYAGYAQLTNSLKDRLDGVSQRTTFQTSRMYDRHGTLLYEFLGTGKRTHVDVENISPLLIQATVSIEDKTFFENQGVDFEGILKAFGRAVNGQGSGGASTITQQLIKEVVLTTEERAPDRVYERKVKEIVLAQELTRRYSKDDILELYLNEIYYGNLSYGIQAASESYFGVEAAKLNLPQAALLAGLPQSPSTYEPTNYLEGGNRLPGVQLGANWLSPDYDLPEVALPKWRQIAVLRQMVDEGYVTEPQARAAAGQDLIFASQEVPLNAPHFVFYVRKLLEDQYGADFANAGLSIYTSLDLNMQRMAQQKAAERIDELQERNIHNASVVVMQPNTGQILAMVGSIDYNRVEASTTPGEKGNVLDGQVNVAVRERQPGSALKPFTYLSAMEQGMRSDAVLWDVPTEFIAGGDDYAPENYNGRWNGPVRMRTSLAGSLNMPAVKALKFAGIDNTLNLLDRVGIKNGLKRGKDYYGLTLTLGGGEVTPLELTTAYNTLASGGRYYAPTPILKITDAQGKTVQEYTPSTPEPVVDPNYVAIITDMMSDDRAREPVWGLGSKLKLSRPAAVKTGTTNDWRDAWAAGFTPYATVAVWTGNNNNEATAKVESLTGGGIIWHNVMEALFADPEFAKVLSEPYGGSLPLDFALPQDVQRKKICDLPGNFNNYEQELFAPQMLQTDGQESVNNGCNISTEITVARLSAAQPVSNEAGDSQDEERPAQYCRVPEGMNVPADRLTRISIWKTPAVNKEEEKVDYRWDGGRGTTSYTSADSIPVCNAAAFGPTEEELKAQEEQRQEEQRQQEAALGIVRMPDLRRFGENQARELLSSLGIYTVVVDYQDRARIPDLFDQYAAYAVISSQPGAGDIIQPGQTVVLGVRAPEAAPPEAAPQPTPEPAPAPPPAEAPTPEPLPVP